MLISFHVHHSVSLPKCFQRKFLNLLIKVWYQKCWQTDWGGKPFSWEDKYLVSSVFSTCIFCSIYCANIMWTLVTCSPFIPCRWRSSCLLAAVSVHADTPHTPTAQREAWRSQKEKSVERVICFCKDAWFLFVRRLFGITLNINGTLTLLKNDVISKHQPNGLTIMLPLFFLNEWFLQYCRLYRLGL